MFGHTSMDSIPAFVMRTGNIAPVSPDNARRDIGAGHIERITRGPVGLMPSVQPGFAPSAGVSVPSDVMTLPDYSNVPYADVAMLGESDFGATLLDVAGGGRNLAIATGLAAALGAAIYAWGGSKKTRTNRAGRGALVGAGLGLFTLFASAKVRS